MGRMFSPVGGKDNPSRQHRMGAEESAGGTLINPVRVVEATGSRQVELTPTGATMTRLFHIIGLTDTIEAQTYGPAVGEIFPGGLRAVRRLTTVITDQQKGLAVLLLEVTYEREQSESVQFLDRDDFRVSGETIQIKQVKQDGNARHFTDTGEVTTGGAAEDGRTIGYNRNTLEAEGVAVLDPILTYTATRYLDGLTTAQLISITNLQGKVNSTSFFGFAPGEVLYLGASIADLRDQGKWQIRHDFQFRANRISSPLRITLLGDGGDDKTISIQKEGWEYITFTLADKDDKSAPQYAHVWEVFETASFVGLPGLGFQVPWQNRAAFPPILSGNV